MRFPGGSKPERNILRSFPATAERSKRCAVDPYREGGGLSMGKRHSARLEAIRCGAAALERFRLGETLVAIHEDLTGRGEITMAYVTFVAWMKRFRDDQTLLPSNDERGRGHSKHSKSSPSSASPPTPARKKRKPGEPYIGSIGIAPSAWRPSEADW